MTRPCHRLTTRRALAHAALLALLAPSCAGSGAGSSSGGTEGSSSAGSTSSGSTSSGGTAGTNSTTGQSSAGTSGAATTTGGSTGGTTIATGGATAGGGRGLDVPQTVEMMAGIGGTVLSAHVCQNLALGGGLSWSLVSGGGASVCPGGEPFVTFVYDGGAMEYRLNAGTHLTETFDGPPVDFDTTSHGDITLDPITMREVVAPLPENTEITVVTLDGTSSTFMFEGTFVTVTAFELP